MEIAFAHSFSALKIIILLSICAFVVLHNNLVRKFHDKKISREKFMGFSNKGLKRKDWHDWKFIKYEMQRIGPGEQGKPVELTDPAEKKLNRKLFRTEGLYAVVSDKISVNRSLPDTRHPRCKTLQYLSTLPVVSVIIISHNEYPSILKRTIHSVYNRTPHELLLEIIIVNDASTKKELYSPFQDYVKENFDERVKIVNLSERKGLIVSRMEGARKSSGEVLVFLDAHMEVNQNWLPPLLEPIALNPKTATVPIIDNFLHDTFAYESGGNGSRGVFDWNFIFHWLPRRPEDLVDPLKPAPTPIMLGGVFAIRKDYFFYLGGYDEQLEIWNGENYELSFKLWLCGGQILEVACSRVGHTFRNHNIWREKPGHDFLAQNFKRVAEVWLDDYKQYLYRSEPERYAKVDAGDLAKPKKIRERLNCKPFKYFLEKIMPDMVERFPYEESGRIARGTIRSLENGLCVDSFNKTLGRPIGLKQCGQAESSQSFVLTKFGQIRIYGDFELCLDLFRTSFLGCHFEFGNQLWIYNLTTHQILHPPNKCLTAWKKALITRMCNTKSVNQKWLWGFTNITVIKNMKIPVNF